MIIAEKTLDAIEKQMVYDQGSNYRKYLKQVIGTIGDAYSTNNFPFRSHLGASILGADCERKIWYSFRWASLSSHPANLIRLFNRGHLEEARFIAMLLSINVLVLQQDSDGRQFRLSDAGGHLGGSGDGVLYNIPDIPNTYVLAEFKTANDKSYNYIKKYGVESAKYEHYVQMQIYMKKFGLKYALYLVINKNNDHLHGEIIVYTDRIATEYLELGINLIKLNNTPNKIGNKYSFSCKYCDYKNVCHDKKPPYKTCRSCQFAEPSILQKGWVCLKNNTILNKNQQFTACENYVTSPAF